MKMVLTTAATPAEYIACVAGWQGEYVNALRSAVLESAPELEERLKWGHLVYFLGGPVLMIRAEPNRVLLGLWRGKHLRELEPRLRPGGKYEMATLELKEDTPLQRTTVLALARKAAELGGVNTAAHLSTKRRVTGAA